MGKSAEGCRMITPSPLLPPILTSTKFGLDFIKAAKQNIPSHVSHRELSSHCASVQCISGTLWTVLPTDLQRSAHPPAGQVLDLRSTFSLPMDTSKPVTLRPSMWGALFLALFLKARPTRHRSTIYKMSFNTNRKMAGLRNKQP